MRTGVLCPKTPRGFLMPDYSALTGLVRSSQADVAASALGVAVPMS